MTRTLRLCFLGNERSVHVQRVLHYCASRGHEVHLVTYAPTTIPVDGVRIHALVPRPLPVAAAATADDAPTPLRRWFRRRLPYGCRTARLGLQWLAQGLRRVIVGLRPDIVHGHFLVEHGFYAALAEFTPLVVSAWGSDVLLHAQRSAWSRLVVIYTVRKSALIHSVSPVLTAHLRALGADPARILTVPFGVEAALLALPAAPLARAGPRLICTRMFQEVYNLPTLLRAVALLRRDHPEIALELTGAGPLRPACEQLVAQLGLQAHVQFLGLLPRAEMLQRLAGADLYVSPSWSDGSSVSLLEAMAVGVVPVVSDIPGNREWIQHDVNGLLADPRDPAALAAQIRAALARPAWRREAAQRNRAIIRERAVWEDQMHRLETAYQELVA